MSKLKKGQRPHLIRQMRQHEEQAAYHSREAQRIRRLLDAAPVEPARTALQEAKDA